LNNNLNIQNYNYMEQSFPNGTIIHDYQILGLIGIGGFSEVYRVNSLKFGVDFAAKVVHLPDYDNETAQDAFEAEIKSLMRLDHPNVIRLYDHFQYFDHFFLILELCNGGSLTDMVELYGPFSGNKLYALTRQIISAVAYIHSQKIAHHDIKPQNILFDSYGRPKLLDFGISINLSKTKVSPDFRYSLPYAPPELLNDHLFSPYKADFWSLGITLIYAASGELPYQYYDEKSLRMAIKHGLLSIPPNIDMQFYNAIKDLLHYDPNKRITIEELCVRSQGLTQESSSLNSLIPKRTRNSAPSLLKRNPLSDRPRIMNRTNHLFSSPISIPTFIEGIPED